MSDRQTLGPCTSLHTRIQLNSVSLEANTNIAGQRQGRLLEPTTEQVIEQTTGYFHRPTVKNVFCLGIFLPKDEAQKIHLQSIHRHIVNNVIVIINNTADVLIHFIYDAIN